MAGITCHVYIMAKMKQVISEFDDLIYNLKRVSENIEYGDFSMAVGLWYLNIQPVLDDCNDLGFAIRALTDYHREFYPQDYFDDQELQDIASFRAFQE